MKSKIRKLKYEHQKVMINFDDLSKMLFLTPLHPSLSSSTLVYEHLISGRRMSLFLNNELATLENQ